MDSLLRRPNTTTCPRCDKGAPYVVPTYWGGKFGALCPKCCVLANKQFDKTEWPPLPEEWGEPPEPPAAPVPGMDAKAAQVAKHEAMNRVEANADPDWKDEAFEAVIQVAMTMKEFTPDDIWDTGLIKPGEARALGPVMSRAAKAGVIEKTGRNLPTRQESRHGTDVAVWRSLVYGKSRLEV